MAPFGFCSGFYESSLVNADCQQCIDFYPEKNESGAGKSPMQLLPTPGTKTFAKLYDDIPGLEVVPTVYQGNVPPLTLTPGIYYAALALFDGSGRVQQRSRIFGPFTVGRIIYPPELHLFGVIETFAVRIPLVPPAGYQWYVYFGTDRTKLNQRLPIGVADPIVSGASFLTNLPAPPDFIVDPAMGYVITSQGLAQPTPGTGLSWYVLTNGPTQGNQSASLTIPHFDTTNSAFSAGVLVRATGAPEALESYYLLGLSASAPQIAIYRFNRALLQQVKVLASQDSIAIPDGSILQLSVSGQDLVASLNGAVILTITDAQVGNLSSGTTGFITTGPAIASFSSSTNPSALSMTVVDPGTAAALAEVPVSNAIYTFLELDGRVFVATAAGFWELYSDGYGRFLATILNDFKQKVFAANPLEVLLSSGGKAYLYNLAKDAVTEIDTLSGSALQAPVISVGFTDSYFIALLNNGRFQISGILDGSTWDPADITQESVFADTPVGMKITHREIVIFGRKQAITYYNSGNPFFPFDVVPGSFAEMGVGAADSIIKADNTLFWVGADERGEGMAWRAQGYTPMRLSTHAIEEHWRKFSKTSDAIGWSYQEAGHTFLVWYFPLEGETWVSDVATQLWHQRTKALRSHVFAFGKHLVGDAATATIYEQSVNFLTHDGVAIRRVRRSPYIHAAGKWITMPPLELDLSAGTGPMPPLLDGQGLPRSPQAMVRFSDTSGKKWSNERVVSFGQAGEFLTRVILRRLGHFWGTRGRVFELVCTDPVYIGIVEVHAGGQ
jgi:hypothetical protein